MRSINASMRWMIGFWIITTFLFLFLEAGDVYISHPALLHSATGLWLALAVLAYTAWYSLTYRWLVWPNGGPWTTRLMLLRLIFWAGLMGCTFWLKAIDPLFTSMFWPIFGLSLGLLRAPWNMALSAIPLVLALTQWQIWPTTSTPQSWFDFSFTILTLGIYCAMAVMFTLLLQQRYARERIFRELEAAHAQLRQAHTQLAAAAEHDRELAVLRERERLAREMHDTLGHTIVLATVKLEAIRRLMTIDQKRAAIEIDATQAALRAAMGELRTTLVMLRAPIGSEEPVGFALARFAREVGERVGWQVDCVITEEVAQWPAPIQHALSRIGHEAIANAERHAHARTLLLSIREEAGEACLRIGDDGRGLPELPLNVSGAPTSPQGHFGLAGMQERVRDLGGTLRISAALPHGTVIEARIPVCPAVRLVPEFSALETVG